MSQQQQLKNNENLQLESAEIQFHTSLKNKNKKIKNICFFLALSSVVFVGILSLLVGETIEKYEQKLITNQVQKQSHSEKIKENQINQHNIKDIQKPSLNAPSEQSKESKAQPSNIQKQKVSVQSNSPTPVGNEQKKRQALQKYYSDGLKHYYRTIYEQVHLIKVISPFPSPRNNWVIVNGLTNCEQQTCYQNIQSLTHDGLNNVNGIVWYVHPDSRYSQLVQKHLINSKIKYHIDIENVDVSYGFLKKHIVNQDNDGGFILMNNLVIMQQNWIQKLEKQTQLENNKCLTYVLEDDKQKIQNQMVKLNTSFTQNMILYCNPKLLSTLTPFNLAYQNVYTFNELLSTPLIAHTRSTGTQQTKNGEKIFKIGNSTQKSINETKFVINSLDTVDKNHMCYVSVPTQLGINFQMQQLRKYVLHFNNFESSVLKTTTIVLTLLYNSTILINKDVQKLFQNIQQKGLSIKIRYRHEKISPALETYEGVRTYCPQNSVVFVTRWNVQPHLLQIYNTIRQSNFCFNEKYVVISNYISHTKQTVKLIKIQNTESLQRDKYIHYFNTHFQHAQIFCGRVASQLRLQIFKWQQVQFYESQSSFIIPLFELTNDKYIQYSDTPLYTVKEQRILTSKQKQQTKNLQLRTKYKNLNEINIVPLQYSELNNYGYRRYPTELIPRIIHQIWLSNSKQISPIRKKLTQTVIKTNPQFEYKLWTLQNMTRENFPIVYDGILKFQQLQKIKRVNYRALFADLMRIELLYKFGGIYMDLKIGGKQSLLPFLKYEQFYLISNPGSLVNGFIGSVPGDRHLRIMLQDFFAVKNLHVPRKHIYEMTGGTKMAEAYTKKEIYTQLVNFQQFILQGPRPCIKDYNYTNTHKPDPDQEVFSGVTAFHKKQNYKLFIPCKLDPQKYVELYDILGRTYFPGAKEFS